MTTVQTEPKRDTNSMNPGATDGANGASKSSADAVSLILKQAGRSADEVAALFDAG